MFLHLLLYINFLIKKTYKDNIPWRHRDRVLHHEDMKRGYIPSGHGEREQGMVSSSLG